MAGVGGFDPAIRSDGHEHQRRLPVLCRLDHAAHPLLAVDRKMGAYPIKVFTVEVGHRQPLGVGGAGLALLSALPDSDVEEIIQANEKMLEHFGALTGAKLRELVESTRNRGYSLISDFAVAGVTGLGKAILDRSGYPLAAISVTTVSQRMDDMHRNMVSH